MNPFVSTILPPALQLLLVSTLQKAIWFQYGCSQDSEFPAIPNTNHAPQVSRCSRQEIPLRKAKDERQVWYISAIALKLADQLNVPALTIAQTLGAQLPSIIENADGDENDLPLCRVLKNFTVRIAPPGWIYLQLTPTGLALWLQLLTSHPLRLGDRLNTSLNCKNHNQILHNYTNSFNIQYTHARCAALLRLAEQDGLIQRTPPQSTSPVERFISAPYPLPWLNADHTLRFTHATEYGLVDQLIRTLDGLFAPPAPGISGNFVFDLNHAHALSERFQAFYAACRIWGDTKATNPELAQVRLGLVSATQLVLRFILEDILHGVAPEEL